ncbi:MAG: hypothetical protein AAFQ94_03905 [Bacteroidota bacterium]
MRLKNTSQWLIMMIAFFIFSCQSQDDTLIEKDISVSEVQSLYQHLNTTQSNGRQTSDLEILWDEARYKDVSTGDALVFPVQTSTEKYVRLQGTTTAYPLENQAQAFAYRSDDGSLLLDYVQMIPTAQTESFTGYVSVSDWNGDPKHLFHYENGLFIGQPNNGRSEDLYCYWIDTQTCTVVTSGGFDYAECETSSTLHCHTIDIPPTIAPGDFGDPSGGGGPGSGSGSTELCPHPTIAGQFISCEAEQIDDQVLKDILKCHDLNNDQYIALANTIKQYTEKCGNKKTYDYLKANSVKLCFDMSSSLNAGGYNYGTQTISFNGTIKDEVFAEEFFHAYQDRYYGGLGQYTNTGRVNIEFEAKFYYDLTHGGVCCETFKRSDMFLEYFLWLTDITDDFTTFPTWDDMKDKYFYFVDQFKIDQPAYDFPTDPNLKPNALFNALNNC